MPGSRAASPASGQPEHAWVSLSRSIGAMSPTQWNTRSKWTTLRPFARFVASQDARLARLDRRVAGPAAVAGAELGWGNRSVLVQPAVHAHRVGGHGYLFGGCGLADQRGRRRGNHRYSEVDSSAPAGGTVINTDKLEHGGHRSRHSHCDSRRTDEHVHAHHHSRHVADHNDQLCCCGRYQSNCDAEGQLGNWRRAARTCARQTRDRRTVQLRPDN